MNDTKHEMAFGDRGGGGRGQSAGGRDRGPREDRGGGDMERGGGRGFGRRKVCRYCADKNLKVDYKNAAGNCARHQREVATAIKRGRQVALLPFTVMQHP